MSLDLLIPFGILIALAVFLIYSRTKFEKEIVSVYEQKFEEWKLNNKSSEEKEKRVCKELVGLVYKEEYNISIELLDNSVSDRLKRGKFSLKDK